MSFEIQPYHLGWAVLHWLAVIVASGLVALFVGSVIAMLTLGSGARAAIGDTLRRGWQDLTRLSPRRIWALAMLALKESLARRALLVLGTFIVLFMAANLFLRTPEENIPAKPYVSFVLTVVQWLLIPVALLLACWGLPADIKDRSLHTVVTKPVRRSEIVIGRMLGYGLITTMVLAIVAVFGWIWILRVVPERSQNQLISRVPVYGSDFYFIDRAGQRQSHGINVGDVWEHRSYVEGQTNSRVVWLFTGLDPSRFADDELRMEYRFEAFRSYKGNVDQNEGVRFRLFFVNEDKGLRVPFPQRGAGQEIREFVYETMSGATAKTEEDQAILVIPRELNAQAGEEGESATKVDLFNDIIQDGKLQVELVCEDARQYIGAAQTDLFIRLPDRPFAAGYFKAMLGIWLMVLLVIMIGTAASCFLKGPVATLMTFGLVILGSPLRSYMEQQLEDQFRRGRVLGGGMLESAYRLVTQMNQQVPLPENIGTKIIQWLDTAVFSGLAVVRNIIPDFRHFNMTEYVANGFDVPFSDAGAAVLPSIMTTLGYLIPCVVLGYFSLQLRELESK